MMSGSMLRPLICSWSALELRLDCIGLRCIWSATASEVWILKIEKQWPLQSCYNGFYVHLPVITLIGKRELLFLGLVWGGMILLCIWCYNFQCWSMLYEKQRYIIKYRKQYCLIPVQQNNNNLILYLKMNEIVILSYT